MQKKLILIGLVLLFTIAPGFAADETPKQPTDAALEEPAENIGIPVLMYHHVLPESMMADQPYNAALISFESFKMQMKWLKDEGWTALSLEEFHQAMTSEDPLPEKNFVLTFDDGYASNLFFAFPTLNRYGFPAAEFIITANLEEETRKWDGKKLSWKDVEAISSVFSIHSHSHSFHQMEEGRPYLTVRNAEEIQADLDFAWDEIDRHIEPGFRAFAYPYGIASDAAMEVLKNQNVQLAFTTKKGYALKDTDLLLIPRFSITPSVTMSDFMAIFEPERIAAKATEETKAPTDANPAEQESLSDESVIEINASEKQTEKSTPTQE